mmetsp:Transcript_28817/g.44797  ORF Transcript_28817/g.44797 Transcript_28817/m.44797 type:complete len:322 (+) Transcript_28817:37-1002(+)
MTSLTRSILRLKLQQPASICQRLWLSTSSNSSKEARRIYTEDELASMVSGLSSERANSDENVAAYLASNFTEDDTDHLQEFLKMREELKEKVESGEGLEEPVDPLAALNINRMSCHTRCQVTEEGTRAGRRMRKQGMIPGVIYGRDPVKKIPPFDEKHIIYVKTPDRYIYSGINRHGWRDFESRVYDLTVEETGEVHRVLPTGLQVHPVKEKFICLNFIRYFSGKPIKIPIKPINVEESPAMKRGGFIVWQNRHLECVVEDGVPIPEFLELECTGLERKQVLRQERLTFPDGVKVSHRVKDSWLLGSVFGKAAKDEIGPEA